MIHIETQVPAIADIPLHPQQNVSPQESHITLEEGMAILLQLRRRQCSERREARAESTTTPFREGTVAVDRLCSKSARKVKH